MDIVCRLGGFHLLMSFLGSIGHLMGGSGIEELLEQIYAANVIHHVLSGKAYARALRGHLLVHTALLTIIIEDLLKNDLISTAEDLASVESSTAVGNQAENTATKIQQAVDNWVNTHSDHETTKYWLQYMR